MTFDPLSLLSFSVLLGLLPIALTTLTSFVKVSIVFSLLRSGFGTPQIPSQAVVGLLSLIVSMIVLTPIYPKINERLSNIKWETSSREERINTISKVVVALTPWFDLLEKNSGAKETLLLTNILKNKTNNDVLGSTEKGIVCIAAFVLTELKSGFLMALVLLVPFLIIDIVCAQILTAVGLTLLSPTTVSLPLKLLMFVQVDGWLLITNKIVESYRGG